MRESSALPSLDTVSGSRHLDLLACLVLACLVVGSSCWRLRVYHQIMVWDLSLTAVAPDGARRVLPTPEHLRKSFQATAEPGSALASLERDIRLYMQSEQATEQLGPGNRLEWLIRYSHNSAALDQQRLLAFGADGAERLDRPAPAGLEQFLFAPASPASAAIFRAALAVVLAVVFWPRGGYPGGLTERLPSLVSPYDHLFLTTVYWLLILAGLALFGAGWRPRVLGFLLAGLLLPLLFLPHSQLSSQVLLVTLLAFSLVRSDAQYSLRTALGGSPAPSAGPIWPIRLIQLQLSALYAVNALAKSTAAYLSGDVLVGMSLMLSNFRPDLADGYLAVGPLVLPAWLLATASTATEWILAIGFWFPPLRVWVALLGVAFHITARFFLSIFALDLVSVFLYLAFLLPFDRRLARDGPPGSRDA